MTHTLPTLRAHKAALELLQRRKLKQSGERLEEAIRPINNEQAILIQDALIKEYAKEGIAVRGWKCLVPPSENTIVVGPIFDCDVHFEPKRPVALRATDNHADIEPETAFIATQDYSPRNEAIDELTIDKIFGEKRMAFELIKGRYTDADSCEFAELLADGLFNQGLVLGPVLSRTPEKINIKASYRTNENQAQAQTFHGIHPNNNPKAPLLWLMSHLKERDVSIQQGQAVITGSYAGVIHVPLDEKIHLRYEGLAEIELEFTSA